MACVLKPSAAGCGDFTGKTGEKVTIAVVPSSDSSTIALVGVHYNDQFIKGPKPALSLVSGCKNLVLVLADTATGQRGSLVEICDSGEKTLARLVSSANPTRLFVLEGK